MESSHDLGKSLTPPSQRLHSSQISEGDWEDEPSIAPPFPRSPPPHCPEPSQVDIQSNIMHQACMLDLLIHSIEGSSFGITDQLLEALLGNLLAFFFPKVASAVTSFKHILLYVPDIPKKYGGTGPDPPPPIQILPP
ncbi:hypothetical protein AX15_006561 [Amanita polypyramis BW_CC]|nr:hypothetical protein AX15_006561 [Amanita polypyramis BW_CC]